MRPALQPCNLIAHINGKYVVGYLDSLQMTCDGYIDDVIGHKGAFKLFFSAMTKLFGGK